MRIISYNVNGLRAALKKELITWIVTEKPDVICFQETKSQPEQIDHSLFAEIGYPHYYWHSAEKKGYSGVATYSKKEAASTVIGMGNKTYDSEGRILTTVYGELAIINCYFPSGSSGEHRHEFKQAFLSDFWKWFKKERKKYKEIVVLGDYNIVHGDLDIHNPTRRDKPSGFRPEERAWMDKWFNKEMNDAFRVISPDLQQFSWWSYRQGSRGRNKGWRIDYMSVSDNLVSKIKDCKNLTDVVHSDHCPVLLHLKK